MKQRISALIDGELEDSELDTSLASLLARNAVAREAWRDYHLIGDALNRAVALSPDFGARLATRLAAEPTVLAPAVAAAPRERRRRLALSAAASIAAVALVSWLAWAPQRARTPAARPIAQVAGAPQVRVRMTAPAAAQVAAPVRVPLPREADDYLLAHQSYSLRGSLQGMMPYVRTVAIEKATDRP